MTPPPDLFCCALATHEVGWVDGLVLFTEVRKPIVLLAIVFQFNWQDAKFVSVAKQRQVSEMKQY